MSDEQNRNMQDPEFDDGIELTDEELDRITGGYIYHDEGDPLTHRKESVYILDSSGKVVMRLEDVAKAQHWASNLRVSLTPLTAEEFIKVRQH